MGSLTIRKLDEAMKARLRLRAARHGRSVEEEARTILRDAAADAESPPATHPTPAEALSAAAAAAKPARVLLIIGGGIAAYKSLDLIRRLRERGVAVRCVLTRAGSEFITPLSVGAIAGERPYTDLFNPDHEFDVGHIRLARDTDLVIVAPATADLMAKMANGHADDLASAVLLATDKSILLAPAMNPRMWANKATQRNVTQLQSDGVTLVGPGEGEMAERGERGRGRMAEPLEIAERATALLTPPEKSLAGYRVLITSGPTHEPIDPVRYIANRSSGKQGHAIAAAAAAAGAEVTLVSGPVTIPDPQGVNVVHVESARDMLAAVEKAMPADIAIFAAAVADWRVARDSEQKIKKQAGAATPELSLTENPDILATISKLPSSRRPPLVIGFAAETEHVERHAREKLARKGCDWIVANDVSPATGIMGGDSNTVHLISATGVEHWPPQSKEAVARMLIEHIARTMHDKMKAKS
ncbi:MAG: bifunctional phosphopantothenoylcysteine decarboxylase/phosphopantothenate--cysteine ligase CoaBC [Rhizobiales bacterium]|nr:bifunctional phosphopantothenoylcysteine decarboxylase/phosphopantothenate--cysteine ligase CoaBC [Hyphomicrobiales bacterium]OJY41163.1 MAG: bifunctional phosphopantothenoylcysteine decarboxylase/phosphopantothenate synthase [Rhizobiales bacterium 64-17]